MARVGGAAGEDDHPLTAVRPLREADHGVVGAAADHQRFDAREEAAIAVVLAVKGIEPIEAAVGAGDEALEADSDEDGDLDGHGSSPGPGDNELNALSRIPEPPESPGPPRLTNQDYPNARRFPRSARD